MRIKHLVLLAAAACVSLPGLAAGPAAPADIGAATSAATNAATNAAPHKAWIDPIMAKRMQGAYRLDDGRLLKVSERRRRLYADLGDGPVEIVHVGDDRFEAVGKELSLSFEGGPYPHAVSARIGPERRMASIPR